MKPSTQPIHLAITRPQAQAGALACFIKQQPNNHYISSILPAIVIQPVTDSTRLKAACRTIHQADCLIFLSPAAAEQSAAYLQHAPKPQRIIAIGTATKHSLRKIWHQGSAPEILIPDTPSSEGLLAMPTLTQCAQHKIMIFATRHGRRLLFAELQHRGAIVQHVVAYTQAKPLASTIAKLTQQLHAKNLGLLIVTSCQSINNLLEALSSQDQKHLRHTPILVSSERIKTYAVERGFQQIYSANNASHQAIYNAIENLPQV